MDQIITAIFQRCNSESRTPLGLALLNRGIDNVTSLLDPLSTEVAQHLSISAPDADHIRTLWLSPEEAGQRRAVKLCLQFGLLTERDAASS